MINNRGHLLSVRYLTGGRQMSFVIFRGSLRYAAAYIRLRRWLAINRQSYYSSLEIVPCI